MNRAEVHGEVERDGKLTEQTTLKHASVRSPAAVMVVHSGEVMKSSRPSQTAAHTSSVSVSWRRSRLRMKRTAVRTD